MTRKAAISEAIALLSKRKDTEEIVETLNDLFNELPLIHWTDKSIRDTVEQFVLDNGRNPTTSDFKKKGMPSHTVIKQEYGITLGEWLEHNYPTAKLSPEETKKKYTKLFIEEYERIKPRSAEKFNKNKSSNCRGWQTVARLHNCKTWRELINKLNLEHYFDLSRDRKPQEFNCAIYTDIDPELAIYNQMMEREEIETPFTPERYPGVKAYMDNKEVLDEYLKKLSDESRYKK